MRVNYLRWPSMPVHEAVWLSYIGVEPLSPPLLRTTYPMKVHLCLVLRLEDLRRAPREGRVGVVPSVPDVVGAGIDEVVGIQSQLGRATALPLRASDCPIGVLRPRVWRAHPVNTLWNSYSSCNIHIHIPTIFIKHFKITNMKYLRCVVFLDPSIIVNASREIIELMANTVDCNRWFFWLNVSLKFMLGCSVDSKLKNYWPWDFCVLISHLSSMLHIYPLGLRDLFLLNWDNFIVSN